MPRPVQRADRRGRGCAPVCRARRASRTRRRYGRRPVGAVSGLVANDVGCVRAGRRTSCRARPIVPEPATAHGGHAHRPGGCRAARPASAVGAALGRGADGRDVRSVRSPSVADVRHPHRCAGADRMADGTAAAAAQPRGQGPQQRTLAQDFAHAAALHASLGAQTDAGARQVRRCGVHRGWSAGRPAGPTERACGRRAGANRSDCWQSVPTSGPASCSASSSSGSSAATRSWTTFRPAT